MYDKQSRGNISKYTTLYTAVNSKDHGANFLEMSWLSAQDGHFSPSTLVLLPFLTHSKHAPASGPLNISISFVLFHFSCLCSDKFDPVFSPSSVPGILQHFIVGFYSASHILLMDFSLCVPPHCIGSFTRSWISKYLLTAIFSSLQYHGEGIQLHILGNGCGSLMPGWLDNPSLI